MPDVDGDRHPPGGGAGRADRLRCTSEKRRTRFTWNGRVETGTSTGSSNGSDSGRSTSAAVRYPCGSRLALTTKATRRALW